MKVVTRAAYDRPVVVRHYCEDAIEFLEALNPFTGPFKDEQFVFRGHSNSLWRLVPTCERQRLRAGLFEGRWRIDEEDWLNSRKVAQRVKEFRVAAAEQGIDYPEIENEAHKLSEAAAAAQHYGVDTDLLDWTTNPFVAAYFAASGNARLRGVSGMAVYVTRKVARQFNSGGSWDALPEEYGDHHPFNRRIDPSRTTGWYTLTYWFPQVVRVRNSNMRAQWGELMRVEASGRSLERARWVQRPNRVDEDEHVSAPPTGVTLPLSVEGMIKKIVPTLEPDIAEAWEPPFHKVILPSSQSAELLGHLRRIGISGSTMFPGLDGAAKRAMEANP